MTSSLGEALGVRIAQILDEWAVAIALKPLRPAADAPSSFSAGSGSFTTPSASASRSSVVRRLALEAVKAARTAPASPVPDAAH